MTNRMTKPETTEEELYALHHIKKGTLLRIEIESNKGRDFCGPQTVRLNNHGFEDQPVWYIDELYNAEYVRQNSTEWYNSNERCPDHPFEADELQVIKVKRVETLTPVKVKIPTFMELMEIKYKDKNPRHLESIREDVEKRSYHTPKYGLYDLLECMENGRWTPPEEEIDG